MDTLTVRSLWKTDDKYLHCSARHESTQIGAKRDYVAQVFKWLAAECHEDDDLSLAIRGYN
jgi:hypothetical protein